MTAWISYGYGCKTYPPKTFPSRLESVCLPCIAGSVVGKRVNCSMRDGDALLPVQDSCMDIQLLHKVSFSHITGIVSFPRLRVVCHVTKSTFRFYDVYQTGVIIVSRQTSITNHDNPKKLLKFLCSSFES